MQPGDYTVLFTHIIRYASSLPLSVSPDDATRAFESRHEGTTVHATLSLHVVKADATEVLTLEKSLADEAAAPAPPSAALPANLDIDTLRQLVEKRRNDEYSDMLRKWSIAEGLASYPVPGMEPVFADWLQGQSTIDGWAVPALERLNTSAARDVLAAVARKKSGAAATVQSYRWTALNALSELGDKTRLPLFKSLANDSNRDLRMTAIRGLATLGGESAVPSLARLIKSQTSIEDRAQTIFALGQTKSLDAIPLLIALFSLPAANQPTSSNDALFLLTHHSIATVDLASAQRAKRAWAIWLARQKKLHIFGPFDCPNKVVLSKTVRQA
ncbi:MAG: HEAT repeat domain-containing protein [Candidatus Eremiobacteraeota bacterium]|nr:HEAT repeat domain-containing protein [Candidatus Eremiobacteraeota bacterium]